MKVFFYHGLESGVSLEKMEVLQRYFTAVVYPQIHYQAHSFLQLLASTRAQAPDVLIGSSMGGWMAYWLATQLGKPALLFNPALAQQSTPTGFVSPSTEHVPAYLQLVVLGKQDSVVNPQQTVHFLQASATTYTLYWEDFAHRIPIEVFQKYVQLVATTLL